MITRTNCKDIVKQLLEINSLSSIELSELLDVSVSTVNRVKRGKKPSFDFISRLNILAVIGHHRFNSNRKLQIDADTISEGLLALYIGTLSDKQVLITKVPEVIGICGYGFTKNFKEFTGHHDITIKHSEGNYELYMH